MSSPAEFYPKKSERKYSYVAEIVVAQILVVEAKYLTYLDSWTTAL